MVIGLLNSIPSKAVENQAVLLNRTDFLRHTSSICTAKPIAGHNPKMTVNIRKIREKYWIFATMRYQQERLNVLIGSICYFIHFLKFRITFHFLVLRHQKSLSSGLVLIIHFVTLRKHAYSNILKILPPKNENF